MLDPERGLDLIPLGDTVREALIDATIERHRAAGLVDDKSITTDIDNDIDLDDLSFDDED